jgi:cytolysin-activating lysine-acyltransferase
MMWKKQSPGGRDNMATQAAEQQTKLMERDGTEAAAKGSLATRAGSGANGGSAGVPPNSAQGTESASAQAGQSPPKMPGKTAAQVLGEIVWIMVQSPRHKSLALSDLEWFVMPAIQLKQFRIFYRADRPVGVALWAQVDDAIAKRVDSGDKRLAAAEWRCGPHRRIVEVMAPFGGEQEIRRQLEAAMSAAADAKP